jgi:hypothetical protein
MREKLSSLFSEKSSSLRIKTAVYAARDFHAATDDRGEIRLALGTVKNIETVCGSHRHRLIAGQFL